MSKQANILEGLHYSILEKWVSNGKVDKLPEGMEEYLNHLTAVLGFHNRGFTQTQIIKRLRATFQLDYYQAKNRWVDAINYFYLENDVKYEAFMNMYADQLDKIAALITQSSTSAEEHLLALKPIIEAAKLREKIKPKETVPDELFLKPNKVYTMKLEDLGVAESVNRNTLAKLLDKLEVEEAEIIKVKQEAGLLPKKIFQLNEPENED